MAGRQVRYIVVRHGSNAYNQSMCNRAVIGSVDARNRAEAMELAQALGTVYNNQYLELILWTRATVTDSNAAVEADYELSQRPEWMLTPPKAS